MCISVAVDLYIGMYKLPDTTLSNAHAVKLSTMELAKFHL